MTSDPPDPVFSFSNDVWDRIEVASGLAPYAGRVRGGVLEIDGAKVPLTFAWSDGASTFVRCGAAVVDLRPLVPEEQWSSSLAGGTIVAALLGHPRRRSPGGDVEFVWSDHIAIAAGLTLADAMRVSRVRTPQPAWLRAEAERLRVKATT